MRRRNLICRILRLRPPTDIDWYISIACLFTEIFLYILGFIIDDNKLWLHWFNTHLMKQLNAIFSLNTKFLIIISVNGAIFVGMMPERIVIISARDGFKCIGYSGYVYILKGRHSTNWAIHIIIGHWKQQHQYKTH